MVFHVVTPVLLSTEEGVETQAYVVTPHLNRLKETAQMRGHNIWFR